VPVGVAAVVGGRRVLPQARADKDVPAPDVVSGAGILAAVTLFVLATVEGRGWGWDSPATLGVFCAAIVAIGVTVTRRHAPNAVVEAELFRTRTFTVASAVLCLYYLTFAAYLLIAVLFLQGFWHYSALRAGLAIAPGCLMAGVVGLLSGRISATFGRAIPAAAGPLTMAAGAAYWLLTATPRPAYLAEFLPPLLLAGISTGLTQPPLLGTARDLPAARAATGSAVLNMFRQVGSAAGVAGLVALMATAHPNTLSTFSRGWLLIIGADVAATIIMILCWPRRAAQPAG
jgi:hypothetical protein